MAVHSNGEDAATPFNRPIPQWDINKKLVDPTAHRLAEGGSLEMNDRDRTALNAWFHDSFKQQFQHASTWFRADWFPAFFAPIRNRINENFDKAFASIRKHEESFVHLRAQNAILKADVAKQQAEWVNNKNREFSGEVQKLRSDVAAFKKELTVQTQAIVEVMMDQMTDRLKNEFTAEIIKIQNEVADVRRGFEVKTIVADAARVTEEGFAGLRRELATEIAKSREEMTRESKAAARRTAAAANPTVVSAASAKGKK
jgi:hypothetical protein